MSRTNRPSTRCHLRNAANIILQLVSHSQICQTSLDYTSRLPHSNLDGALLGEKSSRAQFRIRCTIVEFNACMNYHFNKYQQVSPKAPQAFHILERQTISGLPFFDQENWRANSFLGREIYSALLGGNFHCSREAKSENQARGSIIFLLH